MNTTQHGGRYRILEIPMRGMDFHGDKWYMLAIFRKLPDDAEIQDSEVAPDHSGELLMRFKILSKTWDNIPAGDQIPKFAFWVADSDVTIEKRKTNAATTLKTAGSWGSPGACICDMLYTGLRHHKFNCPAR